MTAFTTLETSLREIEKDLPLPFTTIQATAAGRTGCILCADIESQFDSFCPPELRYSSYIVPSSHPLAGGNMDGARARGQVFANRALPAMTVVLTVRYTPPP